MRWNQQTLERDDPDALAGLERKGAFVRSITSPDFAGMTFHEITCKSALNKVPRSSEMPFSWTVNPYRGCSHACVYCFARGTHTYLDLDSGADFDQQIVVKVNVGDVVRRELAHPSWKREPVQIGTNTDPYQRAEGKYALMPDIISSFADSGTPLSILTKGTLLRRDLPLLCEAREAIPIDLAMSVAVMDDALQKSIEPGTPSATARLATVKAAAECGFDVTVFLMPILPHLTDSVEAIDDALSRVQQAGATRVIYGSLHLRPGAKEWFMLWLEREHPELVSSYRGLYPGSRAYVSDSYRDWLKKRISPLIRSRGLSGTNTSRKTAVPPTARMRPGAPTLF